MRKHKHYPQFTKRSFSEAVKNFEHGRRAHHILSGVRADAPALASAKKRAGLYMHSSARKRSAA